MKNGNLGNHDQGFSREDTAVDGKRHGNKNKNVDRQKSNQEPEVEVSNFHDAKVIENGQWFKNKSELSWSSRGYIMFIDYCYFIDVLWVVIVYNNFNAS